MVRMHLAKYFRQRRLEMGLSVAEVVRMLGYKKISKGSGELKPSSSQDTSIPPCLRDWRLYWKSTRKR